MKNPAYSVSQKKGEGTILIFGDRDIMIVSTRKPIVLKLYSNVKLLSRSKSHIIFEKECPDLKWPKLLDDATDVQNVSVIWDWDLWYKNI